MRRAFTIVESVLATVVVGVMMVAAVQTVAASRVLQFRTAARAQGALLASGLMIEVLAGGYEDASAPVFGPEADEITGTRAKFDDVDDYHAWQESPPQERDGTPMPGLEHWRREVAVTRVPVADLAASSATETGARRVIVTVSHRGVPVVRLHAVRTVAR